MNTSVDRYASVLIITYARTGSTLLQGLLNSIDGYGIRGENYNFIYKLYEAQTCFSEAMKHGDHMAAGAANSDSPVHAFFGIKKQSVCLFQRDCQSLIRRQLVEEGRDIRVFGFKEVRYLEVVDADLIGYLYFLKSVMPNPAFIFLDRDFESVRNSGWWRDANHEDLYGKIAKFKSIVGDFSREHPECCYEINYDDIVGKSAKLRGLYDFLGESYIEQRVNEVLSVRHSF